MAGKWRALGKEDIYITDIEPAFSRDKSRMLDLRKCLLVEKENISRQLALAKFRKNAPKAAAKNDIKDSEEVEEKLQERLNEVTAKLRTEFDIAHAEKVEATSTTANTFCERLPSKNAFESFLVKGVGLPLSRHTEMNTSNGVEKKEQETRLSKLLPPIKLPPLHCQKQGRLPFKERRQRKENDETGNIWEDLLECRYLRLYRANEKRKQK